MPSDSPPPLFTAAFVRLTAAHFLQSLGFSSMLLLPRYLDYLQASRAEIGMAMSAAAVGGLLTRPAVGPLLDRWGRKPTLIAGTVLLSLGMMMLGWVEAMGWWVIACRIVIGVGLGAVFTGYFTFASDLIPESRRTEGLALFGVSGLIPLLVNPLASRVGIDAPAIRWFLPGVGCVILLSTLLVRGLPDPPARPVTPRMTVSALWDVLRARPLWSVWLADAVFSALVALFMAFALVVAQGRGVPEASDVWLAYGLGAVGVRIVGARLPERVGLSRLLGVALSCYVLGVVVLASADSMGSLLVAGGLAGLGHGYAFPILTAQTVSRSPQEVRGSALATFTGVWDFTKLTVPPVLGWLADGWGDATMLYTAAAAGALGSLAWAAVERPWRAPASPSDGVG